MKSKLQLAKPDIELVHYNNLQSAKDSEIKDEIKKLLLSEDKSFVPPLSSRTSTTQNFSSNQTVEHSIDNYLATIANQSIIVLKDGRTVAGFLSYRREYECADAGTKSYAYVSTIIVNPRYRGQRLAYDMYYELFSRMQKTSMPVVTRTWSTNTAHLHILDQLGFKLMKRINNDRGEGIDTVYYRKDVNYTDLH